MAFFDQGKFAESAALHRAVLERRQRTLGPENPDTFMSLGYLAESLLECDQLKEAEAPLAEAMAKAPELASARREWGMWCLRSHRDGEAVTAHFSSGLNWTELTQLP